MKIFVTIFILILSLNGNATNWLTYYVYFETKYIQGPWVRADILEKSDYKYLAPEEFEDLFGSLDEALINKMLSRLKEKKPKTYNWDYNLSVKNDTVILAINGKVEQLGTVKNEITATLILNNFKAVTFDVEGGTQTLTLADITLPYLDLIGTERKGIENVKILEPIIREENKLENQMDEHPIKEVLPKDNSRFSVLLVGSVILNLGLLALLVFRGALNRD